jgi:hypothetical protein
METLFCEEEIRISLLGPKWAYCYIHEDTNVYV